MPDLSHGQAPVRPGGLGRPLLLLAAAAGARAGGRARLARPVRCPPGTTGRSAGRSASTSSARWVDAAAGPAGADGGRPAHHARGRWLRRYRLDELPQLIDVAQAMSLVGLRPEVPRYVGTAAGAARSRRWRCGPASPTRRRWPIRRGGSCWRAADPEREYVEASCRASSKPRPTTPTAPRCGPTWGPRRDAALLFAARAAGVMSGTGRCPIDRPAAPSEVVGDAPPTVWHRLERLVLWLRPHREPRCRWRSTAW